MTFDVSHLRTKLDDYADKYKTIRFRRENGILEMTLHTDGGPLRWGRLPHAELEEELAAEVAEITGRYDTAAAEIEEVEIPLEKSDVRVADLRLVWIPVSRVDDRPGSST